MSRTMAAGTKEGPGPPSMEVMIAFCSWRKKKTAMKTSAMQQEQRSRYTIETLSDLTGTLASLANLK